jgi:hypothetical protein
VQVSIYPNSRRPGVGQRPRREAQRPLLPQHARHCPVLEAGSAAGFLVYPPLQPQEAYQVGYQGEGQYKFAYYLNPTGSTWETVFTITFVMPVGGLGAVREDVEFKMSGGLVSAENAVLTARSLIATDDLGTPAGAVTLRGAWNFRTPPGWDTVYTPVFNLIERPLAPMLVVRVETDWYVHDSDFRFVLQQGEAISATHALPVGQALFVPREEVTLADASDEQVSVLERAREEFQREKAAATQTTPYGLPYSPHYARSSRLSG